MIPELRIAFKFSESIISFNPKKPTVTTPLWILAKMSHPATARIKPLQAATTAQVPEALTTYMKR